MPDCSDCQFDCFCCKLRVRTTFFERLRIRLQGHKNFIEKDPEGKKLIKFKNNQCIFLNNNHCLIYNQRPKPCRDFPFNQSCAENYQSKIKLKRNSF